MTDEGWDVDAGATSDRTPNAALMRYVYDAAIVETIAGIGDVARVGDGAARTEGRASRDAEVARDAEVSAVPGTDFP